jgi:hypothetical protein
MLGRYTDPSAPAVALHTQFSAVQNANNTSLHVPQVWAIDLLGQGGSDKPILDYSIDL